MHRVLIRRHECGPAPTRFLVIKVELQWFDRFSLHSHTSPEFCYIGKAKNVQCERTELNVNCYMCVRHITLLIHRTTS